MKLLSIIMLFLLRANIFAAEDPIADQITQAQAAGKKMVLVLGATPPEHGHFKFPGLGPDPLVVYLNDIHFRDIEHLKCEEASAETAADWEKQFIQGDFNNLSDLSAVQHKFSACFDLITIDFSVSKFINFTDKHLQQFLGMLNVGGTMVFDHTPSCYVLTAKIDGVNKVIASDEEALDLCFGWLDVAQDRLEYKPCVKVNWRQELSTESTQLLRDFYTQYIAGWKALRMTDTCDFRVVEDCIFPYWQATGHTDRDRWIAKLGHYLVMRRLN
jgi:hypothetical protein